MAKRNPVGAADLATGPARDDRLTLKMGLTASNYANGVAQDLGGPKSVPLKTLKAAQAIAESRGDSLIRLEYVLVAEGRKPEDVYGTAATRTLWRALQRRRTRGRKAVAEASKAVKRSAAKNRRVSAAKR